MKRNGLADRAFDSFAALETHLREWMMVADARIHGTTHEPPSCGSTGTSAPPYGRCRGGPCHRADQWLRRRVAHDAMVDVDTVRYSVPHRLVREHVEVAIDEQGGGSFTA